MKMRPFGSQGQSRLASLACDSPCVPNLFSEQPPAQFRGKCNVYGFQVCRRQSHFLCPQKIQDSHRRNSGVNTPFMAFRCAGGSPIFCPGRVICLGLQVRSGAGVLRRNLKEGSATINLPSGPVSDRAPGKGEVNKFPPGQNSRAAPFRRAFDQQDRLEESHGVAAGFAVAPMPEFPGMPRQ